MKLLGFIGIICIAALGAIIGYNVWTRIPSEHAS